MTTTNYNIDYLDTLHVSKFPGQTSWFRIQANEAIYVDFSIPLNYTLPKRQPFRWFRNTSRAVQYGWIPTLNI